MPGQNNCYLKTRAALVHLGGKKEALERLMGGVDEGKDGRSDQREEKRGGT